ncbi:MAG: hypothetical protein ABR525_03630 [Candidatus Limnocylindria bacterium]
MLGSALAHVKWFQDPAPFPTQYGLLLTLPLIAAFAVTAVAVGVAWTIQHRVSEPAFVRALERFAPAGPLVLGLHLGIALVVAAIVGLLFVPSLQVGGETFGLGILVVEGMCGVMIILGLATRAAAVLLALLGIVAMQPFAFESVFEQVHILGIAIFLFIVGRGPFSLDRLRGVKPPYEHDDAPAQALTIVRVAAGIGIAFNALTEKLLDPALGVALLQKMPFLNVARPFGIGDAQFVFLAGLAEFLIGIVIVSGQLTRPVMAIGAVLFTVSLPVFGWSELLGHLPYYGIMFLLFIAPNADSWHARRAMRPAA